MLYFVKKTFSFVLFLFIVQITFAQDFSVQNKRAIQLYKDAEMLLNYNKDYARAIFTLRTVVKDYPSFVEAHLLLGDTYGQVQRYTSQKKSYLKVLEIAPSDPRHVTMYYRLGIIYQKEQNYSEAVKFLEKIEKFPLASKTITKKAFELKQICENEIIRQDNGDIPIAQD